MEYELSSGIDRGHTLIGRQEEYSADFLVVSPTHDVKAITFRNHPVVALLGDCLPEVDIRMIKGLHVAGVTRRRGLLRRFVEVSVNDIQVGDKVVIEDDSGARFKTGKINTINRTSATT
jgi:hypothetical protein